MAQVAEIQYNQKIMEKKKEKEISEVSIINVYYYSLMSPCMIVQIENEAHMAKVVKQADAEYYMAQKVSEANKVVK